MGGSEKLICRVCELDLSGQMPVNCNRCEGMPPILRLQADIISTPEDLQADDAAVSALMMESDITAPIKEQCEENARLMRELAELKRIVDVLKMDNMRLERKLDAATQDKQVAQIKAEKYDAAVSVLAELINDLRG